MKTNKEILEIIFKDLETNKGIKWPKVWNAKINREKLIECWADKNIVVWKYFNYYRNSECSAALTKIFKVLNKSNSERWKGFILNLYEYKHCYYCNTILSKKEFGTNKTRFYNLSDECKECEKEISALKYSKNKAYYKNNAIKYKLSKLNRTPSWANKNSIKEIYKDCPGGYHVDHKIPLQGNLVSGLHVENNLQYLTAEDNLAKSNKYEVV